MDVIRNNFESAFAVIADFLSDAGIRVPPKKIKMLFFAYLAIIFCFGIQVEMSRLASLQEVALSTPQYVNPAAVVPKSYNILTLGGSNTKGDKLIDEHDAYPYILERMTNHKVTNKAISATSSFYPSICIESLLRGEEKEYDVIILEFSLSGFQNFDILVKRLQYRFPDAILIYVHLYSLRGAALVEDSGMLWTHKDLTVPGVTIQELFQNIGGYIYRLPVPEDPSTVRPLFTEEMRYLSEAGQLRVAKSLSEILEYAYFDDPVPHKFDSYDNQWGFGDECLNWFTTGANPYNFRGGKMTEIQYTNPNAERLETASTRHVLEFTSKYRNYITIRNNLKTGGTVPVFLSYILPANERIQVDVSISGEIVSLEPPISTETVIETKEIGLVRDGMNRITIDLKGETKKFEVVGVAFFGFRYNVRLPFKKMHNSIQLGYN